MLGTVEQPSHTLIAGNASPPLESQQSRPPRLQLDQLRGCLIGDMTKRPGRWERGNFYILHENLGQERGIRPDTLKGLLPSLPLHVR